MTACFFQLLNQFENTGPPPADKEKIQALPTIHITEEHVGESLPQPPLPQLLALEEEGGHNPKKTPWKVAGCFFLGGLNALL